MICLDNWEGYIIQSIERLKGAPLEPSDVLLANGALFLLMKSPLWDLHFQGARLFVHNNDTGYSYIDLPGLSDPDNTKLDIRHEERINVLAWKYHDCSYSEDSDAWNYDREAVSREIEDPYSIPLMKELIDTMSINGYYEKFLTEDAVRIKQLIEAKNNVDYVVLENSDIVDISKLSGMADYHTNIPSEIYGHRYAHRAGEGVYIVATSLIGPVGLLHMIESKTDELEPAGLKAMSLSFVSVSPGFRRRSIASEMMRKAYEYCDKHSLLLSRSSPSELGKYSKDRFSQIAELDFPKLAVFRHGEDEILFRLGRALSKSNDSLSSKIDFVIKGLRVCREHPQPDQFSISNESRRDLNRYIVNSNLDLDVNHEFD